jgi:hypothetical protein
MTSIGLSGIAFSFHKIDSVMRLIEEALLSAHNEGAYSPKEPEHDYQVDLSAQSSVLSDLSKDAANARSGAEAWSSDAGQVWSGG